MDSQEKSSLEQRLQNGVYGTPKINPDEQRRYLGTFRERVCLTISNAQIKERSWTTAVETELKKGVVTQVFINGNLPDQLTHPYVQVIAQAGGNYLDVGVGQLIGEVTVDEDLGDHPLF